jgi:hypothetical protein
MRAEYLPHSPRPHLHRDQAHPAQICSGTGAHPAHICTGTGAHQVPTDVLPRREGCAAQGAAGRSAGAGLPAACKLGLTQPWCNMFRCNIEDGATCCVATSRHHEGNRASASSLRSDARCDAFSRQCRTWCTCALMQPMRSNPWIEALDIRGYVSHIRLYLRAGCSVSHTQRVRVSARPEGRCAA